jgi:hypothetical protein
MNLCIYTVFVLQHMCAFMKAHTKKTNNKILAHVNGCKTAFVLFVSSLYFHYTLMNYNYDIVLYAQDPTIQQVSHIVVIYFSSYLTFDLIIGTLYYKDHMGLLAGYIHHTMYVLVSLLSSYQNKNPEFCLFFIEELPTVMLNIGICNSRFRNNNLFGSTFFTTRIVIHTLLVSLTKADTTFLYLGGITLVLHTYWFKNWVTKYFLRKVTKSLA